MKNKKSKILLFLTLSPILVTFALLPFINAEIPVHYDGHGNITRWGSKYELLIIPIIIILFGLVWGWLIKHFNEKFKNTNDEKLKNEYQQTLEVINISAIISIVTFIIIQICFIAGSL